MEHYKFYQNNQCEYFPCHQMDNPKKFNCLFCYCPLYGLKNQCGGNFRYLKNGIKDCSECLIPHSEGGYEYIMERMNAVMELGKKKE